MNTKMTLKEQIYQNCLAYIADKIQSTQQSILSAQETSHAETKSSAGDKYETTRAMMQIDIETHTKRLAEAQDLQQTLLQINWQASHEKVGLGSLVYTNQGAFFIAIGIGQLKITDQTYFVISPTAPIANSLMRKKVGDSFVFNQKSYQILDIV